MAKAFHRRIAVVAKMYMPSYTEELAEIYYRTLTMNGGKEPPIVPLAELQKWEYPKEIQLPEQ
ncbi:hypothetical protein Ga0466249_001277 [Sporomusaceae bacterium BoRhaA]|nr:hypothetical protein [Pelorhabdus rhamnosifermentans]